MLTRIQCLMAISFFLLSCRTHVESYTSDKKFIASVDNIYKKYDYSTEGLDSVAALLKQTEHSSAVPLLYYYNFAARQYRRMLDFKNASLYADSMLYIVNQPQYEKSLLKERALANINKADALYGMKQYKDCYYYYCNSMIDAEKASDSSLTSDLYNHLTTFLYEEGDYKKAISYYKLMLADVTGTNHTYDRLMKNQGILDNIGISFLKEKEADSAIAYFNEAITSIKDALVLQPKHETDCQMSLGIVYGNLGQAYALAHRYEDAERHYKQSIAINLNKSYGNEDALIEQQHLANLYYEHNNIPALGQTLTAIKNGLDSIPNHTVTAQWNYLMSRYFADAKQPDKAYPYLTVYLHEKDELETNKKKASESNIFDQMQLIQSKYNMTLLTKDNEMKADYLWTACTLFMLAIILAGLLLIYAKKTKTSNEKLTVLNNEIQQKQTLLEATLTALEKQNIEKQNILYVVAHDLRNPLSAIYSLAGMIDSEYENEDDNREYLEMIRGACTESKQLISSILEIAENADVQYNFEAADINVILSNSMHLLRMKGKDKNQRIGLMTAQEKGMLYVDIEKINRVIGNLVTNAIKFSPSGSYIEIEALVSDQHITIKVKDNGIGIPEKYHDSIFKAFTDAKRIGTNGEKTFGLGLSISKQIIEKHSGRIWFESEVNKGTTFFIQLSRLEDSINPADNNTVKRAANMDS